MITTSTNSRLVDASNMPMGVRESLESMSGDMSMPVIAAITPIIGTLATHVKVAVHGQSNTLNLHSYIVGNAASGKGLIDNLVNVWLKEIHEQDYAYHEIEDEYRRRKRNGETGLDEPKLPVRSLALNSTVANLAERLANTDGLHSFSFTPEADIVSQRWRRSDSDFSVMLRQAFDGSSFSREARSANAVSVHIKRLLWNVVMCGTPDALYRLVSNCTDGLLTRIAIFRTPDNTFAPLPANPHIMTDGQRERIQQIAHVLPMMSGSLSLDRLEQKGCEWLEATRLLSLKNNDHAMASQRMRICVIAQRMVTSLMLCSVAEKLISTHGLSGVEGIIKDNDSLLQQMMSAEQTDVMLQMFDTLANEMMDNVLLYFRSRLESSSSPSLLNGRERIGKNDTIYDRLSRDFTTDDAALLKGGNSNTTRMMLRRWLTHGLIIRTTHGYQKCG